MCSMSNVQCVQCSVFSVQLFSCSAAQCSVFSVQCGVQLVACCLLLVACSNNGIWHMAWTMFAVRCSTLDALGVALLSGLGPGPGCGLAAHGLVQQAKAKAPSTWHLKQSTRPRCTPRCSAASCCSTSALRARRSLSLRSKPRLYDPPWYAGSGFCILHLERPRGGVGVCGPAISREVGRLAH
jgi:hypothetical protein